MSDDDQLRAVARDFLREGKTSQNRPMIEAPAEPNSGEAAAKDPQLMAHPGAQVESIKSTINTLAIQMSKLTLPLNSYTLKNPSLASSLKPAQL